MLSGKVSAAKIIDIEGVKLESIWKMTSLLWRHKLVTGISLQIFPSIWIYIWCFFAQKTFIYTNMCLGTLYSSYFTKRWHEFPYDTISSTLMIQWRIYSWNWISIGVQKKALKKVFSLLGNHYQFLTIFQCHNFFNYFNMKGNE